LLASIRHAANEGPAIVKAASKRLPVSFQGAKKKIQLARRTRKGETS